MLTSRGWWFLLVVVALLSMAIVTNTPAVGITTVALLGWFFWTGLVFTIRLRLLAGKLRIVRQIRDDRGPIHSLWAGRAFRVHLQLRSSSLLPSPYLRVTERVPFGGHKVSGQHFTDGIVDADHPLEISYLLYCDHAGLLRFEGVQVQLADLQGFFQQTLFLNAARTYRVLLRLPEARGHVTLTKRHNLLPLIGTHRHRRPGSGSELLDLRDYLPGDPPKSIAWKVTARRDRLITKVFESEVPVRCTFFVDASASVRVGPPGHNPLARLVEITAAIAQATATARDLPGLCLFDEKGVLRYLRPGRSARQRMQILHRLTEVCSMLPASGQVPVTTLLPLAYGFASEVYPHLLQREVNQFPWWLPFWAPQPAATIPMRPLKARYWWQVPRVWLQRWCRNLVVNIRQALLGRFHWRERQRYRWRKQLAAVLSILHDLGPGGVGLLLEDDDRFSLEMQHFLAEHQVPYTLPLFGRAGEYLFAAPGKVEVLARALTRAVGKGRDNELFVLLADVLELGDHLAPLVRAVKVALARHHQVILICPWPPGIPLPEREGLPALTQPSASLPPLPAWGHLLPQEAQEFLDQLTAWRLQRAFDELRRTFGRLGVTVLCAAQQDAVQLILDRLERLRVGGRGRHR